MTHHRVENTRVHFWTFSPVSVKFFFFSFLNKTSEFSNFFFHSFYFQILSGKRDVVGFSVFSFSDLK